ncbi:hypothetical protein RB595_003885 [Gaeumannomyces hyphopodioides]
MDTGHFPDIQEQMARTWYLLLCILPPMVMVLAGVRVYTAKSLTRRWAMEDTLFVLAMPFAIATAVIESIAVVWIRALVTSDRTFDIRNSILLTKLNIGPAPATYSVAMGLLKASILVHLLNFTFSASIRAAAYVIMAVNAAQAAVLIGGGSACASSVNQVADVVSFMGVAGVPLPPLCRPLSNIVVGTSTVNAVVDLTIFLMPLLILRPLQMPARRKLQIAGVLAAGGLVSVAAVYRTYLSFVLRGRADITHWTSVAIWTTIELWCAATCACLPSLRPFVLALRRSWAGGHYRSSPGSSSQPPSEPRETHGERFIKLGDMKDKTTTSNSTATTGPDGIDAAGCLVPWAPSVPQPAAKVPRVRPEEHAGTDGSISAGDVSSENIIVGVSLKRATRSTWAVQTISDLQKLYIPDRKSSPL